MVKAITGATLTLGALVGLVAAVLGSLFARPALLALGTPLDVLDDAVGYAQVMMLIMPLLLVFILYTQLLRGVSDTISPLLALMVSTFVGLLLTPALIRGWIGLPPMGIQSAVYAGLVGNAAAMLFLVLRLRHKNHVMAPDRALLAALRLDRVILGKVLRIGLPTGLTDGGAVAIRSWSSWPWSTTTVPQATAAYGAVTQIVNYVQFPALSIAITASILGAQAIGAGRLERIGPILRTGLLINTCLTGGLILLGYLLSPLVARPVHHRRRRAGQGRAPAAHHAVEHPRVRLPGRDRRDHACQRRGADAGGDLDLLCARAWSCRWPTCSMRDYGLEGVWMAFPVTYLAMLALQTAYYRMVWRHKPITRLV